MYSCPNQNASSLFFYYALAEWIVRSICNVYLCMCFVYTTVSPWTRLFWAARICIVLVSKKVPKTFLQRAKSIRIDLNNSCLISQHQHIIHKWLEKRMFWTLRGFTGTENRVVQGLAVGNNVYVSYRRYRTTIQHGVGVVRFSLTASNWYFDGSWSNKFFNFGNFTLICKTPKKIWYYFTSSFQATLGGFPFLSSLLQTWKELER